MEGHLKDTQRNTQNDALNVDLFLNNFLIIYLLNSITGKGSIFSLVNSILVKKISSQTNGF